MLEKLKRTLKDLLLPPFTELEFITLIYLVLLIAYEFRVALVEEVGVYITIFYLVLILFILIGALTTLALSQKRVTPADKRFFALFFYLMLFTFSILSALELSLGSEGGTAGFLNLNGIIIIFILIRSILGLVLLRTLGGFRRIHLLVSQFADVQMTKKELALIPVLATPLYFILRPSNGIFTAVLLTYFYIISFLVLIRNLTQED